MKKSKEWIIYYNLKSNRDTFEDNFHAELQTK